MTWWEGLWSREEAVFLGRLGLAALFGGLIGLERERSSQAAGLRTHMIVGLGACLMMIVSIKIGQTYGGDRARIAAQVVSGIGFLGAGAIMRYGASIRGLTTAACLWTSAGIGLATGSGYYVGALAATFLTLIATFVFGKLEKALIVEKQARRWIVTCVDMPGVMGRIEEILKLNHVEVREVGLEKDIKAKKQTIEITTHTPENCNIEHVTRELGALPEVERIDIES
jgi:putative Mg2+ transporter-C (MgtC) family protein